ncbi:hypothetical protein F511_44985 [Dorcoceras hygrometricum]|uniref:Uncharacterized protein n=1 Tax=Dorcoceras hygrometricum TaxID=472368 RepID=A0A2Z6ZX23_9LAMI|nr:hypothetical protein F511_44985 [Dorcoceras hygrometricum]
MVILGEAGRVLPVVDNTDERRRFATQSKHSKQKSGISFCASARVNRKATRVGQPLEVDCWYGAQISRCTFVKFEPLVGATRRRFDL